MSLWRKYLTKEEATSLKLYKGEKEMNWKYKLNHEYDSFLRLNTYPINSGLIIEDTDQQLAIGIGVSHPI